MRQERQEETSNVAGGLRKRARKGRGKGKVRDKHRMGKKGGEGAITDRKKKGADVTLKKGKGKIEMGRKGKQ